MYKNTSVYANEDTGDLCGNPHKMSREWDDSQKVGAAALHYRIWDSKAGT